MIHENTAQVLPFSDATPAAPAPGTLAESAMLVVLKISKWTATKIDRIITDEVHRTNGADSDTGAYRKRLLPANALDDVTASANALRSFNAMHTLPWADDGGRILAAALYTEYMAGYKQREAAYYAAVDAFLKNYPLYISDAERKLNRAFRPDDYPSADDLRGKFAVVLNTYPVPCADDFRVSVSDTQAAAIRSDIEQRMAATTQAAMADLWERMRSVVSKAHESLSDPKKIYRDTLIGNIAELCEILPRMNVGNDPQLDAIAHEMNLKLADQDPETLRRDSTKRAAVAGDAKAILDKMASYCG